MLKRLLSVLFLTATLAVAAVAQQPTASPTKPPAVSTPAALVPPKTHLRVGQPAPDFKLSDTEGKEVSLHDYKGKQNVVLAFYVLAFTGG